MFSAINSTIGILLKSFRYNCHTLGFHPHNYRLEPALITQHTVPLDNGLDPDPKFRTPFLWRNVVHYIKVFLRSVHSKVITQRIKDINSTTPYVNSDSHNIEFFWTFFSCIVFSSGLK